MRTVLIAVASVLLAGPAGAETIVVQAGRLIVDAAKPARGPSTIVVENGRIARIEDGATTMPGARVVDMRSKTVMPGLIDSHVHLTGEPDGQFWQEATQSDGYAVARGLHNALVTARAGFTTVRDLGSPGQAGHAVRDAIRDGLMPGPRVLSSGPALSITGGHGDVSGFRPEVNAALDQHNTCSGADQCAERAREASKNGADVIKITATGGVLSQQGRGLGGHFTPQEISAITDAAHRLGLKVAAHAHGARGIEDAVRGGVDSIEHGTFADATDIALMKTRGTWMVPTLMAYTGIRDRLGKGVYTPVVEVKVRETLSQVGKALNAAHKAGVPIAFGTDAAVFEHGRNGEELALMVRYGGMTPREALISATSGAATLLGIAAETGTLDAGKSADLIAVDGDPLADPAAVTRVAYVMVRGAAIPMN